jgi:hypothetical protein
LDRAYDEQEQSTRGSASAEDNREVVGGHLDHLLQNETVLLSNVGDGLKVAHAPLRV